MAHINRALLTRLQEVLGIGAKAVYRRIKESNKSILEPNIAALVLASEAGIGINRYSSADERADLRTSLASRIHLGPIATAVAQSAGARHTKKSAAAPRKQKQDGSVFVVHGRNEKLRKSVFDFLRSIGLNPLEWEKAVAKAKGGNPYIEDILRKAMLDVHVIVVLLTPDDEAKLKDEFCVRGEKTTEGKLQGQPRPNVLFEAGWAVGRFPDKTLLVQVGKLRGFTDIGGKHMMRLGNEEAKRLAFMGRLKKFGCKFKLEDKTWKKAGDFKI